MSRETILKHIAHSNICPRQQVQTCKNLKKKNWKKILHVSCSDLCMLRFSVEMFSSQIHVKNYVVLLQNAHFLLKCNAYTIQFV